jgi:putative hydrolase of the HAD superfamily
MPLHLHAIAQFSGRLLRDPEAAVMIKAIVWDFGGVLTTGPFPAFNRFEREQGLPTDFIRRINATNPTDNAWARFESGRIDLATFDREFEQETRAAGHPIPGRLILPLIAGDIRPRMVDALKRCKQHFRVACLTNNMPTAPAGANGTARAGRAGSIMPLFDLVIESSKEGIRKPDPAIYRLTCERLGIEAPEAVFLDDLGVNLKPARALGMKTIKVVDEDQALTELAQHTGLAFD